MTGRMPGLHTESFGAGPDLVMLHGWAMHSGIWRDFAERLARRLRVTLVDLPGHGLSGAIDEFSLEPVMTALAKAAPARAHWLGWSLGALLASGLVGRCPERVHSVILVAGSPRFVSGPDWPGVAPDSLARVAASLEDDFFGTLKHFIGLQTFGLDNARALARHIEARLAECAPPELEALRGALTLLQQVDLRDALRRSSVPSLAVLGARDRLAPKELGPALQTLAPNGEVHTLEMAAHLPFATHPDETAALILDFVRRHDPYPGRR